MIEVDGKVHDFKQEYDSYREQILKDKGLTVLRIKNEKLSNVQLVLEKIQFHLKNTVSQPLA